MYQVATMEESSTWSECRICVTNEGVLPIFGDESNPDISMEITMFGGINLHKNDDLPKLICNECFNLLRYAITFRKSAKKADSLLRRRKKRKMLTSNTKYGHNNKVKVEDVQSRTNENIEIEGPECEMDFVCVKLDDVESNIDHFKNETALVNEEVIVEHIVEEFDADTVIENENEMVMLIVSDETKSLKQNSIHCKYCNINFGSSEEYDTHCDSVEHKRNYVTSFLPKKQRKETVNPKDHKCEICDRMFTKLHYPRHMQSKHKIKMETSRSTTKRECLVCKKMYHPVALIRHMKKAHSDEKDLPKVKVECPICKKLFSKDFYPLHMKRHNEGDKKNFICDQCGKKFFFKSTFYSHRLIHSNNLPHKCEFCPYRGRTKGLLRTHVRTHTGDYPYKCTQCDTRCLTKSNLNAHIQRHRGPVDFICDTCNRGFYSKPELQRHISVIHQGIKNHICNTCGMAFGYRHGLMSHQLNVHKRSKGVGKAKAVYLRLEEEGATERRLELDPSFGSISEVTIT